MIYIASFPRSGNTFCRNLFYDVYGLESSSFPIEGNSDQSIEYTICKTHVSLMDLPKLKDDDFVIYLVRDGRDAIASNALYRKNFIETRSKLKHNIDHGIIAPLNTHFGGWSKNVESWIDRADLIIRFEELIEDPISFLKTVEAQVPLPNGDYSKIKTFSQLKLGSPRYGSGGKTTTNNTYSKLFFNKGKVGQWKDVFSAKQIELFWLFHGNQMESLCYDVNGKISPFKPVKKSLDVKQSSQIIWLKKYYLLKVITNSVFHTIMRGLKIH